MFIIYPLEVKIAHSQVNIGRKFMTLLDTDVDISNFDETKHTPMMVQWHACKKAAGKAILLFRMGDFYEAFYDDAVILAREAELTLTKRQNIPMSGIPWHTSEAYIDKLIAKGLRIAIAEQTEDPKFAKGIVKREVVRVVTPGTVMNSSLLTDKNNNFFASIINIGGIFGFAFLDLTTGEFRAIEFEHEQELANEIYKICPTEFLIPQRLATRQKGFIEELQKGDHYLFNIVDDWHFDSQNCYNFLVSHLNVHNLDGFGLNGMNAGANAAGGLLRHLKEALCLNIDHIEQIGTYSTSQFMSLDRAAQRNLELTDSLNERNKKNTLLAILDETLTPMGGRLLRQWIKQPLLCPRQIHHRQDGVEAMVNGYQILHDLRLEMNGIRDLERLIMKISSGCCSPKDLVALKSSLIQIPQLKNLLQNLHGSSLILEKEQLLNPLPDATQLIERALVDEPPLRINEGGLFRGGYHAELDELRAISRDSKSWIAQYQAQLRDMSGIKTLKIGFTKVFGYYIEVSKGQADKAPESFLRRQTLVNAERYITPELKAYESKVFNAEERMTALESELFGFLRLQIAEFSKPIMEIAKALAVIDALQSLAFAARKRNFLRPHVNEGNSLIINAGRHPVIEALNANEPFVANDVFLDNENNRLILITGPNMAGKSTYIRQVALLVIMAQMGSFIPAQSAEIGIIDKVFTRVGASDDLARGRSTFMVEMTETANILNNATNRSLVILDEIGRGTSTYDGISIAWSIAEYLLTAEGRMPKTLFATHYWELTKLESKIPGAVNYTVAVHESDDSVIFLRKIIKGSTDKSYGIHVGKLAGLPNEVVNRAKEILLELESNSSNKNAFEPPKPKRPVRKKKDISTHDIQLTLFG